MPSAVILQPAGSKDAREHFQNTVSSLVDLQSCKDFLEDDTFNQLNQSHPNGKAAMWGVIPSKVNLSKWDKVNIGNLVLFSADGYIHTSGVISAKFLSKKLAEHLWTTASSGDTWSLMYTLDEIRPLKISYSEFSSIVGYKNNYIIQGFNVLDEEKSIKFLDHYQLYSEKHFGDVSDDEFEDVIKGLDGDLDRKVIGWHRKEQQRARKRLLKGKSEGTCFLCGRLMSAEFLIAAHIKRRSECTAEEKRDIDAVMMLACKFGCDYLFEIGYIGIQSGFLRVSNNLSDQNAQAYLSSLRDRETLPHSRQKPYFDWHFENRFQG